MCCVWRLGTRGLGKFGDGGEGVRGMGVALDEEEGGEGRSHAVWKAKMACEGALR